MPINRYRYPTLHLTLHPSTPIHPPHCKTQSRVEITYTYTHFHPLTLHYTTLHPRSQPSQTKPNL
ncbi:hypothetical protein P153DRAFT_368084 [Dothidotthia symphoricarpi CBS 119687]|uniref:Uncharacterized protein n=1 Tax=Dothidotthia symphoricarpi CBS 119687 TaxID=1392245 RepID=A0A6A6AAX5_9PLEO|nr:uncharacterized protein P153DRAFT_368084 [Dothidotthia symphoricarpi CBS 119687]KAF2128214.1 hypothetical protein P153DRAFT_368084 [Dothidotthia symphoricarpi CBS 119687]